MVFDGGFTSVIDLAFGRLYVVEIDEKSWVALEIGAGSGGTINACDLGTLTCEEAATGAPTITAITFAKDGALRATRIARGPGVRRRLPGPVTVRPLLDRPPRAGGAPKAVTARLMRRLPAFPAVPVRLPRRDGPQGAGAVGDAA